MIKNKLKSKNGATLVFAMAALVIAAIVCSVVIYAAQANAGRVRSARDSEQAHLTLGSAASLVRSQLADTELTVTGKAYSYTFRATKESGEISYSLSPDEISALSIPPSVKTLEVTTKYPSERRMIYNNPDAGRPSSLIPDPYYSDFTDALGAIQEQAVLWSMQIMEAEGSVGATFDGTRTFILKADNMEDVYIDLSIVPGATGTEESEDERNEKNALKYYLTAVISFGPESEHHEMINMSFMANFSDSSDSALSDRISFMSNDPSDNRPITVEVKMFENSETHQVAWKSKNVLVNTASVSPSE